MKKVGTIVILSFLLLSCKSHTQTIQGSITVASFNIQIFGVSKAGNTEVMDILALTIRNFDLVAIQEIRDASETAIYDLLTRVNETGKTYAVIVGPRVGRTSSKEQYAYIYDTAVLELLPGDYTYDDDGDGNDSNDLDDGTLHPGTDEFEREPYAARFKVQGAPFDFTLVNIHTKPDDAVAEIAYLNNVFTDVANHISESDIIILGDFNADGSYYNEEDLYTDFPPGNYISIIGNSLDTTEAVSDNTYDRIIATKSLTSDFTGSAGVYRFDTLYDFSSPTLEPNDVSDHYPVYAEFFIGYDTD